MPEQTQSQGDDGRAECPSQEQDGPEAQDAAPTDFRKHVWFLVVVLTTVVIAAVIARAWNDSDRPPSDSQVKTGDTDQSHSGSGPSGSSVLR